MIKDYDKIAKMFDELAKENKKLNKSRFADCLDKYDEKYQKYLKLGGQPKSLEKRVEELNYLYENGEI
jgi:hypothetical protein